MATKDYTQLAGEVVKAVGGKENIISVTNCMTRLRFVLKDASIPNKEEISKIKGVKGTMNQGGQYQIIIGTHVSDVITFVQKEIGVSDAQAVSTEETSEKKDSLWNRFFKTISGCVMPMIGPLVASGMIKGILVVLVTAGILQKTDGTYLILYAAADALMYFMPIMVGFTCGKMFKCNPYVTAVIGGAMLYPDLIAAVAAEGGITFLTIPVANTSYANTFLPILLASFVASKIEKFAKKVVPEILQMILVPSLVLGIVVPLEWLAIEPVMNIVSNILSTIVMGIFNFSPLFGGIVIGACWQLVVLLGLHTAFIPILMNNLFSLGSDPVNGIMGLTVWALAGIALGYALRSKNQDDKSMGFGNMVSALCGVTEPTIYAIALPNIKLFVCSMIGGGIAGGIFGALGGRMYTYAGDGLFRIPAMINPEGLDISFYGFIVCAVIAFVISAVLAFFMTGTKEADDTVVSNDIEGREATDKAVFAPVSGEAIPSSRIADETFASGIMGEGVGIIATEEVITAPFSGTVTTVADTKHALGLTSDSGVELLIHVGIDTVKMNGEGFKVFVKEGQHFTKGQKLFTFDQEKIKKAGYDATVAVLVLNRDDYSSFDTVMGNVTAGEKLITAE